VAELAPLPQAGPPAAAARRVPLAHAAPEVGGELGAVVYGAKVPCILTSRGDSELTKLYSIALAAINAK